MFGDALFNSATFEGEASFRGAVFDGRADFELARFCGRADFQRASFHSGSDFTEATFLDFARFHHAHFHMPARFWRARFQGDVGFQGASFRKEAWFQSVTFGRNAGFRRAAFHEKATFGSSVFHAGADFDKAAFRDQVSFRGGIFQGRIASLNAATMHKDADFKQAEFAGVVVLGPFVCGGVVDFTEAVFGGAASLSFAARDIDCRRTHWASKAELHLRFASLDLSHALIERPFVLSAETQPFVDDDGQPLAEDLLNGSHAVSLRSLRGVDAAHLLLSDIDLSRCLLLGTVHLDSIRLEGRCSFAGVPSRQWSRWPPRYTPRATLAEEHQWRDRRHGWTATASSTGQAGPAQLAPVYRALRKALEDDKDEPGAADFYYGEMEMRRKDRTGTTRAERGLLNAYWLLSGYGLRASRALAWLAASMLITISLMMAFGLPQGPVKQEVTGTVLRDGGRVTFQITKPRPHNPTGDRFSGKRFDKAVGVTLNSVVFRSSGQDLTTTGTYIEMASRLTEPVLLGLAALAIRNRIKR
ncbi:pentapeptide repeat-containing protein [Streptomyces xanthochromogenes]|uniref:pentapeptide repeat-containing protein n=1 Tax=Streptomyces xanthochromogenes TaxID=67384 RepID=UPI003424F2E1